MKAILAIISVLSICTLGANAQTPKVPGVVVNYIPASSKTYIGSPSICILPNGDYIASHDHFGMATTEHQQALTAVYRSSNRGKSWQNIAEIQGQFWSNRFYHRDALYISGSSLNNHFFELFSTGMGLGPKLVSLIYALLYVGITFIPAYILYRRKIFIKL